MTLSPFFTDPQFLDASAPGGMNPAFTTVLSAFESLASGVWAAPGLLAPDAMSVAFSSTTGTIGLPQPFGIVTSGGVVLRAFGTNTGQSTTNYSVAFGSLIPGTGSITAYLAATVSLIQENPFPIPGPPPGHPSYNPNFIPTIGYAQNVYSIALSAVTGTAPDNINTFELFRTTLTAGQSSITSWNTAFQKRASEREAAPYTPLASGGILVPSQANSALVFTASGITVTLPPASGAAGLSFMFINPLSVTGTVATTGSDVILGAVSAGSVNSVIIPPSGSITLWGNGPLGQYETTAISEQPSVTGTQVFHNSGTLVIPVGVTEVFVRMWAAGGGGGGSNGFHSGGSAGGGGGYCEKICIVTPGSSYPVQVGTGGTGGTNAPTNGTDGGSSSITALSMTATGGKGGFAGNGTVSISIGAGGTSSSGDFNVTGAAGTLPTEVVTNTIAIGQGGAAYGTPANLQSNTTIAINGPAGLSPGGGGCGGALSGGGGNGANGIIIVRWKVV